GRVIAPRRAGRVIAPRRAGRVIVRRRAGRVIVRRRAGRWPAAGRPGGTPPVAGPVMPSAIRVRPLARRAALPGGPPRPGGGAATAGGVAAGTPHRGTGPTAATTTPMVLRPVRLLGPDAGPLVRDAGSAEGARSFSTGSERQWPRHSSPPGCWSA